ncbi:DUF998 domain-containing protein [Paenibacillus spongiae]|uniref:DUF998 domain-containing protein n=1 Tax=Paenibacillus spongiae TaxID=2909671 RepID=A0ABY5SHK0_9BACL|nr:DUF998 domain-containing protein [Paenibacillus spongiae]UVI33459.1 DUF998 domain-containing protein [Paenibacillus spongiae]
MKERRRLLPPWQSGREKAAHSEKARSGTEALLRVGMAIPFLYFGIPAIAAPFYPGYSFIRNTASHLGSNHAVYPLPVNAAIILLGIATLIAAFGFLRAFLRLGTHPFLAWLTSIAVFSNGLGTLLSGIFPSPDPRHGGGIWGIGTFLLPLIFAIVLWKQSDSRIWKGYLAANLLLFAIMIPIMSGMVEIDKSMIRGLLQRILAFTAFTPIGVGAYMLQKRLWSKRQAGSNGLEK